MQASDICRQSPDSCPLHPKHNTRTPPSVSTTLAAFAAALADQMRPMWAELVRIEESLHPQGFDLHPKDDDLYPRDIGAHAKSQRPLTLLGLEYQLQVHE